MKNKIVSYVATLIVFYIQKYNYTTSIITEIGEQVGILLASGSQVSEHPTAPEHVEEVAEVTPPPAEEPAPVQSEETVTPEETTPVEVPADESTAPPVVVEETAPVVTEEQTNHVEETPAAEVQPETTVTPEETAPPVVEETPAPEPAPAPVVQEITLEMIWAKIQEMQQQIDSILSL